MASADLQDNEGVPPPGAGAEAGTAAGAGQPPANAGEPANGRPAAAAAASATQPGQPLTLLERIEKALENLVVLRATTVIGSVTATGADEFDQITGLTLAPDGQQVSSTSINMLLGDCSLILTPSFVDNAAYKQLHDDSVKQALAVRQQTIDLLKQAFDAFKDKFFH